MHNDGYKRPQTPHNVIYVNSILMYEKKKAEKKEIEYKFAIHRISRSTYSKGETTYYIHIYIYTIYMYKSMYILVYI